MYGSRWSKKRLENRKMRIFSVADILESYTTSGQTAILPQINVTGADFLCSRLPRALLTPSLPEVSWNRLAVSLALGSGLLGSGLLGSG